jgi:thiamine phosphate synthase YjbQ (UPF0047 family)
LPISDFRLPIGNGQLAIGNWQWAIGNGQLAIGNWQSAIAPDHANMLHKSGSTAIVWFFQPNLTVSFQ